jgi:hypothetical protein
MSNDITHNFHIVDELPHGASVLVADEEGEIHTYFSLACSRQVVAADLTKAFTYLARCGDYKRIDRLGAAVVLPLTGLAGLVAHFAEVLNSVPVLPT